MTMTISPTMRFAGYAALFGIADAANDVISPGAFRRTLEKQNSKIPIFWQHKPEQVIGVVDEIAEDSRGLRVIGKIDNPQGRASQMLARRDVDGLSFGYRARQFRKSQDVRLLDEIDLFEVSLVTHPLQHGARVHFIA